jgi:hypothetical protein
MPQPPAYTIATDFSADESANLTGRSTVRTANLDTELTNIKSFVDQARTNLALIQADDGTIKDDAVDLPTLADDVINYITTNGNGWFASDTGAVNAMVVTLDPAPTSLTNGMFVVSDIKLTNTATAVTLNVNGLGAKSVVTDGAGTAPSIGALTIGTFYGFQYDSSADKFQVVFSGDSLTHSTSASTSATASAASAAAAATSYDNFDDRFLGSKTGSDPTVDNDGDALIDGALMFRTDEAVMKVYDLSSTTWLRTTPSSSDQTKINTVSGIASDVTAVAGKATEIGRLGTVDAVADMAILGTADVVADMNTLGTADVVADMNTLGTADVVTDMNTLGTADVVNDMNVLGTSGNVTNMNTLGTAGNVTAMANCSGSIANINTTATNISSVNTTATNISEVNNFANTYRIASSDPVSSLDEGDLVFNTTTNKMRVYNGSAWQDVSPTSTTNVFETLSVAGQSDIVADSSTDTLTIAGGGGTTITTNAGTDTITISSASESAFKTLAVSGQSDIVADSSTDTLTLATGDSSTLTITTNAGTDTMTFTGIDNSVPMAIALG